MEPSANDDERRRMLINNGSCVAKLSVEIVPVRRRLPKYEQCVQS